MAHGDAEGRILDTDVVRLTLADGSLVALPVVRSERDHRHEIDDTEWTAVLRPDSAPVDVRFSLF